MSITWDALTYRWQVPLLQPFKVEQPTLTQSSYYLKFCCYLKIYYCRNKIVFLYNRSNSEFLGNKMYTLMPSSSNDFELIFTTFHCLQIQQYPFHKLQHLPWIPLWTLHSSCQWGDVKAKYLGHEVRDKRVCGITAGKLECKLEYVYHTLTIILPYFSLIQSCVCPHLKILR